ncbi:MAG: WxL protein peptidoglycan domain-containing protein [Sporichthyaceae bacterium]
MSRRFAPRAAPARSRTRRAGIRLGASALAMLLGTGVLAAAPTASAAPTAGSVPAGSVPAEDPPPADENTLTWSVRPTPVEGQPLRPNFLVDVPAGAVVQDSVRVKNFSKRELSVTIYASDARTTESGALDLLPAGEKPRDVGAWIVLEQSELKIAPGETTDVKFTMTVPENAESGDHVGGIVTSYVAPGTSEGQPVKLDRRLGTRVQVRIEGPLNPGIVVTGMDTRYENTLNPLGKGKTVVSYTVKNTGNVRMAARQRVKVSGLLGIGGKTVNLKDMPELLPGNSLTLNTVVPGVLPAVRSSVKVQLSPVPSRDGDNFDRVRLANASSANWTPPWGYLIVLILAAAIPSAVVFSRHMQKQREEQRVEEAIAARLTDAPTP